MNITEILQEQITTLQEDVRYLHASDNMNIALIILLIVLAVTLTAHMAILDRKHRNYQMNMELFQAEQNKKFNNMVAMKMEYMPCP